MGAEMKQGIGLAIALAKEHDRKGRRDAALDIIYPLFDDLMTDGKFGTCDEILDAIDVEDFSEDLIIGFLSVTLSAADRMKSRREFWWRSKLSLIRRYCGDVVTVNEIMHGL